MPSAADPSSVSTSVRVRPFSSPDDYRQMIEYFHGASDALLDAMGVDRARLPAADAWLAAALADHELSDRDPRRRRFYLAWEHEGATVGHSSIDRIRWGSDARGHLHLWRAELRARGTGRALFALSVHAYFERFALDRLWVEPKADNAAPNRTLAALGFRLLEQYRGMPGEIQYEQDVNRYAITRDEWETLPWSRARSSRPDRHGTP